MPTIYHDQEGFEYLVNLHSKTRKYLYENIKIDMQATDWFDADMCAAFGAILYRLGNNLNTVSLINIPGSIKEILLKNGFLGHYGWTHSVPDLWGTTIPYKQFDIKDSRYFSDYIDNEFILRSEIPEMSPVFLKNSARASSKYSTTRYSIPTRNWEFSVVASSFLIEMNLIL